MFLVYKGMSIFQGRANHDEMMRFKSAISARMFTILCLVGVLSATGDAAASSFRQPAPEAHPDLFVWTDTCNVYVLRDGDAALLIDLGDGSVLDQLGEIGVGSVEWVLLTHHHREQCQGIGKIDRSVTKVAAPKAEQALFEKPTEFRKWYPKLDDEFSVYGASYARPPRIAIPLDRALEPGEDFTWRGYKISCQSTPGHSPGGMSYVVRRGNMSIAFTGGVMHDGSKMTTWFDSEWDYGFAKGIDTLIASVGLLIEQKLDLALPSHGPAIRKAQTQLATYRRKLTAFRKSYVRGYPVSGSKPEERDSISKPTAIPLISQVTPHLYKLSHQTQGKNFAIIISDSGKGLILDCGLFPELMLHKMIFDMRQRLGLKEIDAFWISHMHGDHFLLGPALKKKYGAKAWTLDRIVDKCEHPRRYDYAALVSAYSDGFDGMKIDKAFRDGETIEWEGYKIHVDWMPGQTEFGCCLWLELDGKRIAFTGDNLFGNPADEKQDGHECVVARNSAIFEEGYVYGSRYLMDLKPDIVMGSHSYVMDNPAAFLERYHEWSKHIITLYRDLLPEKDYEYLFDPYWVSAFPYRVDFSKHEVQTVTVTVRNFRATPQQHRIELKLPAGVTAKPAVLEGLVPAESRRSFEVELTVDSDAIPKGLQIVPFDITLDGKRYGELFDFLIRASE
ncbi:MAG: glyoxylase-like metal-dependent hydrolase (beta-lactamase superfamily II) [Verrucomicrobiales bacterium]|jgi:glyoxylase-like metal-dependent hydrolase (beta-lactamase superfamily II)